MKDKTHHIIMSANAHGSLLRIQTLLRSMKTATWTQSDEKICEDISNLVDIALPMAEETTELLEKLFVQLGLRIKAPVEDEEAA